MLELTEEEKFEKFKKYIIELRDDNTTEVRKNQIRKIVGYEQVS